MKQEFDHYIEGYRSNCDKALALSGESSAFFAEYKAKKLAEWFPNQVSSPISILDFGCGDGVMTHFVKKTFPKALVHGVDPSPKSIETAQKQFHGIQFSLSCDQHSHLDFKSESLDLIFSAGVFHHIPFSMHKSYIHELTRLLKPNGHLVIFELNPLNPLTVLTFKRNPIDKHAKMMTPWYTRSLEKEYGKTTTKFYCFYPKFLSWLRRTEPFLTKLPLGALYASILQKSDSSCL